MHDYRGPDLKEVYINGVDQGHINGIRVPDYDGVRTQYVTAFDISFTILLAHYGCHF